MAISLIIRSLQSLPALLARAKFGRKIANVPTKDLAKKLKKKRQILQLAEDVTPKPFQGGRLSAVGRREASQAYLTGLSRPRASTGIDQTSSAWKGIFDKISTPAKRERKRISSASKLNVDIGRQRRVTAIMTKELRRRAKAGESAAKKVKASDIQPTRVQSQIRAIDEKTAALEKKLRLRKRVHHQKQDQIYAFLRQKEASKKAIAAKRKKELTAKSKLKGKAGRLTKGEKAIVTPTKKKKGPDWYDKNPYMAGSMFGKWARARQAYRKKYPGKKIPGDTYN